MQRADNVRELGLVPQSLDLLDLVHVTQGLTVVAHRGRLAGGAEQGGLHDGEAEDLAEGRLTQTLSVTRDQRRRELGVRAEQ